ncbi:MULTISPECIES: tyrosine-type recombinase/integrase [unclassified Rhizobium]|uniref:tyrosine-type recombinase/integrase n=1 Tax=unclassified Rhizobium TaxID=2613769 RepID=UPI001EEFF1ED|nr:MULTISPECIES: hypothetical protein [unclassified Rhizobium]
MTDRDSRRAGGTEIDLADEVGHSIPPARPPAKPFAEAQKLMRGRQALPCAAGAQSHGRHGARVHDPDRGQIRETVGMKWCQVDRAAGVWTMPPERMKAFREHRVPLTPRALGILDEMAHFGADPDAYVFPGQQRKKKGRPLSTMTMEMVLRRMVDVTVHGFRSSFRDWCGEESTFPREVAEAVLAHIVGDETERPLPARQRPREPTGYASSGVMPVADMNSVRAAGYCDSLPSSMASI